MGQDEREPEESIAEGNRPASGEAPPEEGMAFPFGGRMKASRRHQVSPSRVDPQNTVRRARRLLKAVEEVSVCSEATCEADVLFVKEVDRLQDEARITPSDT